MVGRVSKYMYIKQIRCDSAYQNKSSVVGFVDKYMYKYIEQILWQCIEQIVRDSACQ